MKGLLLALLPFAAHAVQNCVIPGDYVMSSSTGGCMMAMPGYIVWGYCVTGLDRVSFPASITPNVRVRLTTDTSRAFTSNPLGATLARGCVVPPLGQSWNVMPPTTVDPLSTTINTCTAFGGAFDPTASTVFGAEIACDMANDYYPVQGVEGSMVCLPGAGVGPFPAATPPIDYFASGLLAGTSGLAFADSGVTRFMGDNMLKCTKACPLPASICTRGHLAANLVGGGTGFQIDRCTLRATSMMMPMSLVVRCANTPLSTVNWTITCNPDATGTNGTLDLGGLNMQCGSTDGASLPSFTTLGFLVPQQQSAGEIDNFPTVVSVLTQGFQDPTSYASFHDTFRDNWNDNPAQELQNGFTHNIMITGCEQQSEMVRKQCVQQTLNWWRCMFDIPFQGGTICYANGMEVACPTHSLGFRCPSSSKKGLYGLLGLIGLIPLLIGLLCCLAICCIRRKRSGFDMHFATYATPVHAGTALAPGMHSIVAPSIIGGAPQGGYPIPLGAPGFTPGM